MENHAGSDFMPHSDAASELERSLREAFRAHALACGKEPLRNPILLLALEIGERLKLGELSLADVEALVKALTLSSFADRADHARTYLGEIDPERNAGRAGDAIAAIAGGENAGFDAFRAHIERPVFGVVLTAHPTFSINSDLSRILAQLICERDLAGQPLGETMRMELMQQAAAAEHRPPPQLTLDLEHRWSMEALENANDALDRINRIALERACELYPDRWTELCPRLVTLATWVGYDLDGRADITWRDTLGKRLLVKQAQLRRWETRVSAALLADPGEARIPLERLRLRLMRAREAVEGQQAAIAAITERSGTAEIAAASRAIVERSDAALTDISELRTLIDRAIAAAGDGPLALSLLVLRASFAHGLGLGQTHVRLNASQIHNSMRSLVDIDASPREPMHRRSYLNAIGALLDSVTPESTSFGSVVSEHASARRLFMLLAQMAKHVDADTQVRFLIAETEAGFTLLSALYFAKLFGIDDRIEISPLFETAEAMNHGDAVIEEALRNPHFRAYVEKQGRLTIQFGFSDSGRYVGQMAATFVIERLRLRLAAILQKCGLTHIEIVLFNTHGESIGRGAHPVTMEERFRYLCPPATGEAFQRLGIAVKEETSFQGGDGYLWFMHPAMAFSVLRAALENRRPPDSAAPDPVYEDTDFATEFFSTIEHFFENLVDDPDYAALLGAFGTSLVDRTGSRPMKRQVEFAAGVAELRHPSQLRAIPNNTVLQQLGILANTVSGVGAASARDPDKVAAFLATSSRFRCAMHIAQYARSLSEPQILAAYVASLDPTFWLDRAAQAIAAGDGSANDEFRSLSAHMERLGLHDRLEKVHRTLYSDFLLLQQHIDGDREESGPPAGITPEARETLLVLHAVRLALIHRIWMHAVHVPEFSPQSGATAEGLIQSLLHLNVPGVVEQLKDIFPVRQDDIEAVNFGEAASYMPESRRTYEREHATVFDPMMRTFEIVRQIGSAVNYHMGAVG